MEHQGEILLVAVFDGIDFNKVLQSIKVLLPDLLG